MSSSLIPKDNHSYNNRQYWDKRYERVGQGSSDGDDGVGKDGLNGQSSYDWLVDYSSIRHIIDRCVPKWASILMLGCGNSLLSEQMFIEGYHNIENIDYSAPVIKQMASHCPNCCRMKWTVMDCRQLKFADQLFDVVIEKATIDAMLTRETNPWSVSADSRQQLYQMLREVSRVLRPDGLFISISFSAPHFRYPLYKSCFADQPDDQRLLTTGINELGDKFHYYCYSLVKSADTALELEVNVYEPPTITTTANTTTTSGLQSISTKHSNQTMAKSLDANSEESSEDYLFNINL